jgi:hypothetical protein
MRYSSIILGDVEQFLFFFPPLCVCFAANSSVANKSQVYLLQHDKSSRHADTGLVETKWAQENRKNKKIKKNKNKTISKVKLIQLQNHITTW